MGGGNVLFLSGNWQQWSEFSDNQLIIDTDAGNRPVTLDRDWDDTWAVAVGFGNVDYYEGWSVGVAYESSPADDDVRTIDFPVEENWKFSLAHGRRNESGRGWSLGATLQVFGDAKVDQTSQRVRFAGEFDDFYVLFVGATLVF
ncbi:MAG: outer membrane protein transport protein, partial [Gammaproteobacteria bacterium]